MEPGDVCLISTTEGSHLGWLSKCSVATNRKTSDGAASMSSSTCRRTGPPRTDATPRPRSESARLLPLRRPLVSPRLVWNCHHTRAAVRAEEQTHTRSRRDAESPEVGRRCGRFCALTGGAVCNFSARLRAPHVGALRTQESHSDSAPPPGGTR